MVECVPKRFWETGPQWGNVGILVETVFRKTQVSSASYCLCDPAETSPAMRTICTCIFEKPSTKCFVIKLANGKRLMQPPKANLETDTRDFTSVASTHLGNYNLKILASLFDPMLSLLLRSRMC